MSAEVIVIGAGVGGLTTAAILSQNGVETLVLEASDKLGGRFSYQEKDGFLLDYGLHVLPFGYEGAASRAFSRAGIELDLLPMEPPLLFLDGEFLSLPNNVPSILKTKALSASDKLFAFASMIRMVANKPEKKYGTAVEDMVWGLGRSSVRTMMEVISGICMISPDIDRISAGELMHFLRKALRAKENATYPKGGSKQLILKLKDKVEESGKISTGTKADSLVIKKGRVQGVRARGETLSADCVVCASPLQDLSSLVDKGDLPAWFMNLTGDLEPNSGISIDVAFSRKISDSSAVMTTADPMTLGCFPSNADPSVAPEGKQLMTWFYPVPYSWAKNRDKMDKETTRLRELLTDMFPEWEGASEWERVLVLPLVDGIVPIIGQDRTERPEIIAPNVPNLFFAGDTTSGAGKGGDIAFDSAVEAAGAVLDYLDE